MSSTTDPGGTESNPSGSVKFKQTHLRSLHQIFNDKVINSVPYFQRNYTWESTTSDSPPVAKLWYDFIRKYNDWVATGKMSDAEYMLGTMVFVKQKPPNKYAPYDNYEIVDGQQRMSTITMIICIVRDIIIENEYESISNDKASWPRYLEKYIDLVEIAEDDLIASASSAELQKHVHWKLVLNRKDKDLFEKWIQIYKSVDNDEFADEGKDFIKLSSKMDYLREQLKSKSPTLVVTDSQKLFLQAYVFLYDQIQESLLVALLNTPEATIQLEKIEIAAESVALKNIEESPDHFELDDDFFNNEVTGHHVLLNSRWSAPEYEAEFKEKYNRYAATGRGEGKSKSDYIKSLLSTSTNKLKPILKKEKEKQKDIEENVTRKGNLSKLYQFLNGVIMQKMFVTRAEVSAEKDAFQIFDTMNSAGTELSKSNLIKSLILKHVPESDQESIATKWDDIIIGQESERGDVFILHSLRSRGLKDPTNPDNYLFDKFHVQEHDKIIVPNLKNLYDVITWKIESRLVPGVSSGESIIINAKKLVTDLVTDAAIFDYLLTGDSDNPGNPLKSVSHCLLDMNHLNYSYIRLPMYTAYRTWGKDSNEFILLIKFLVPFFFKYKTISKKNATKLESNMIKVCEMIKNGNSANTETTLYDIIKFLLSTYPDEEFEVDFKSLGKDDDILKYILHRINTFLADTYTDVAAIEGLNLEHILPKSPKKGPYSGGGWEVEKFFDDYTVAMTSGPGYPRKFMSDWVWELGNLTLLHYKSNKTIGNSNFGKKLTWTNSDSEEVGYTKSRLPINEETVVVDNTGQEREDWTALSLIERTEFLNSKALEVWKLPEIYCNNTDCYGSTHPVAVRGTKKEVFETVCIETRDKDSNETGNECGNKLIVKWHKLAPEYSVSTAYVISDDDPPTP